MCDVLSKFLEDRENLARSKTCPPNRKSHCLSFSGGIHGQGFGSSVTPFCCKIGASGGTALYGWPSRLYWPNLFGSLFGYRVSITYGNHGSQGVNLVI